MSDETKTEGDYFYNQAIGAGLSHSEAEEWKKTNMERLNERQEQAEKEQNGGSREVRNADGSIRKYPSIPTGIMTDWEKNSFTEGDFRENDENQPEDIPTEDVSETESKGQSIFGDMFDKSEERLQKLAGTPVANPDVEENNFQTSWLIEKERELKPLRENPQIGYLVGSMYDASISTEDPGDIGFWSQMNHELKDIVSAGANSSVGKKDIRALNKLQERVEKHIEQMKKVDNEKTPKDTAPGENQSADKSESNETSNSTPESAGQGGGGDGGSEDTPVPLDDEGDNDENNGDVPDPLLFDVLDEIEAEAEAFPQSVEVNVDTKTDLERDVDGISEKSPEQQREIVRKILDGIESKNESLTSAMNGPKYDVLNDLIRNKELAPDVENEVRARLRLHETAVALQEVSGKTEDYIEGLRKVVGKLAPKVGQRLLLEGQDFNVLFSSEGIGGDIHVAEAFKLLQRSAFEGTIIDGGDEVHYQSRMSETQGYALRRALVRELEQSGDTNAEKSIQLAERLMIATFERSVLNQDVAPGDPLSQAIYLEKYRRNLKQDYGPEETVKWIPGFGTSFLRDLQVGQKENRKHAFNPGYQKQMLDDVNSAKSEEEQLLARNVSLKYTRYEGPVKGQSADDFVLDVDNFDFTEIGQGSYEAYLAGTIPSTLKVKDLLLKSDWKPEDFKVDEIGGWTLHFSKVDPDNSLKLRYYLVFGALSSSWSSKNRASHLLWSQEAWRAVRKELLTPVEEYNEGEIKRNWRTFFTVDYSKIGKRSFLSAETLRYLEKKLKPALKMIAVSPKKF